MFDNKLKTDAVSEAIKKIMEADKLDEISVQVPTKTGTIVYGGAKGGSAKAYKDQHGIPMSGVKGPSDKELKAVEKEKKKEVDEEVEELDELSTNKMLNYRIAATKQLGKVSPEQETKRKAGIGVSGSKIKASLKKEESEMSFAERLIEGIKRMKENKGSGPKETFTDNNMGEDYQLEEQLDQEINEVLSKNSKAGTWIHDFVHSDNPKFAGKSQAKRKEMALAAYYAKQRNEEVESLDEVDLGTVATALGSVVAGGAAGYHIGSKIANHFIKRDIEKEKKQKELSKVKKEEVESLDEAYKEVKVHSDDGKHIGTITHGMYQSVAYAHPTTKFGATKEPAHDEDSMMLKGPHDTQRGIDFIKAHHKDMTEAVDPNVKTTDTLKGTLAGGKPNSFKSFKIKLKEEEKEKEEKGKEKEEKEPDDADDEGSAADKAKDAKEAKKRGMTMAQWEKSKEDKKQDKEEMDEERDPPFEGGVPAKKDVVTDKSGAKHTPMSRVKDLARQAMKKVKSDSGQ